jgi:hypothetical protein
MILRFDVIAGFLAGTAIFVGCILIGILLFLIITDSMKGKP